MTIEELEKIKQNLKKEVIELDDKILFQNFGVFKPQYNFAELEQYKSKLNEIRDKQKEMIKNDTAALCSAKWKMHGSEIEGKKLIQNQKQQIIKFFNIECDICIDKVKFSNYENTCKRIYKAFETQNKLFETTQICLNRKYLLLKLDELELAYEYQQKKQEEKERLREQREQQREEARVAKEIEEQTLEIEKEISHYVNEEKKILQRLEVETDETQKEMLNEKYKDYHNHIIDANKVKQDLEYRKANCKVGYVYIISNIGAFGENIYKIGMTRRLEYEDRINELSGASVPFKFDIHAAIFTDDAPKLESALHNAFADKKVNLINGRKEFFNVTLDEIKKVVYENYDKTVEWKDLPDAQQYRETIMVRRKMETNNE